MEYFIETPQEQGIRRKLAFTKETVRMAFGMGLEGQIQSLAQMRMEFNEQNYTRVGFLIETQIAKLAEIEQERDPILWACTLFINTSDEDRRHVPTEAARQRKIDHWADEGVSYPFFRGLLVAFSGTLNNLFESTTPTSAASPQNRKED